MIRCTTHLCYCCFQFSITFRRYYILPGVSSVASVLQTSCFRSWLTGALVPFLLSRPTTQQHEYHQNRDLTTKKQRPVHSICRNGTDKGTSAGKFLSFFRINCFTRPAFQVWSVTVRVSERTSAPSRPLFISDTGLRIVKNPKPSLAKRYKLLKQSPEANSSLLRDFEFA